MIASLYWFTIIVFGTLSVVQLVLENYVVAALNALISILYYVILMGLNRE